MITSDAVRTELKQVIDPEVMLNIVDMGLVYDINVKSDNDIDVTMTLTTPHCPMGPEIIHNVERVAGGIDGAGEVKVNIVWDPPWSPNMFSDDLKDEMRALGMEFDEDIVNQHTPVEETPIAAPPPKKKRGGILGWIFGR
ncbi:MAG: DUF59 domain-containing protein [Caldilineales bacterium]|nr:DUF59 domain-containing protein [Caldilineales bacterium]